MNQFKTFDMYTYDCRKMVYHLPVTCNLDYGLLWYSLLADTIGVALKIRTLNEIHIYKTESKSQKSKYSPWGNEIRPYLDFKRKIKKYLHNKKQLNKKTIRINIPKGHIPNKPVTKPKVTTHMGMPLPQSYTIPHVEHIKAQF